MIFPDSIAKLYVGLLFSDFSTYLHQVKYYGLISKFKDADPWYLEFNPCWPKTNNIVHTLGDWNTSMVVTKETKYSKWPNTNR